MSGFFFDGERLLQVSQIEAVEPTEREQVVPADAYGDRPEVLMVEARAIHMISGATYVSTGSFLEVVDLLMSIDVDPTDGSETIQ